MIAHYLYCFIFLLVAVLIWLISKRIFKKTGAYDFIVLKTIVTLLSLTSGLIGLYHVFSIAYWDKFNSHERAAEIFLKSEFNLTRDIYNRTGLTIIEPPNEEKDTAVSIFLIESETTTEMKVVTVENWNGFKVLSYERLDE